MTKKTRKPRVGKWFKVNVCITCDKVINEHNRIYNHSICPNCGYNSHGTICDTYDVVIRVIRYHPRWRIWDTDTGYQGRDNKSITWLKTQKFDVIG